jgi:hypothetical protein
MYGICARNRRLSFVKADVRVSAFSGNHDYRVTIAGPVLVQSAKVPPPESPVNSTLEGEALIPQRGLLLSDAAAPKNLVVSPPLS